jgi:hypothetical protein
MKHYLFRLALCAVAAGSLVASASAETVDPVGVGKQIYEDRCIVCHGCYDAPCQLKLSSIDGLQRGASKIKVYDGTRIKGIEPTRLGIDATSTTEWREKGFFPVVSDAPGAPGENLEQLKEIATEDFNERSGLAGLLVRLPVQGIALRWKLRRYARGLNLPSGPLLREMLRQATQMALLERRIVLWGRLQQMFHYWHVFHKPFAIVMYLFAAVHIGVVLVTGYGWMSRH